jgi:hypothetical protein
MDTALTGSRNPLEESESMNETFGLPVNRRSFIRQTAVAGCAALAWPLASGHADDGTTQSENGMRPMMAGLLHEWCDALVRAQVRDAARPELDGLFLCPACEQPHGRCGDAVYPLLHMAKATGETRYLDAAVAAVNWLRNVDSPDGAWTNDLDKNSWKGITVFASIAQAEAIRRHGDLLDKETKERWLERLKRAAEFIHTNFNMHFGNINYGITGSYAMVLLGRLFNEPKYTQRGHELAHDGLKFMTKNHLVFGEAHPQEQLSPRGCPPVDLGYNVEETLPSLTLYALMEGDAGVLAAVTAALKAQLEFMLPDGAWDNSWGTRSYKWTYWGSRTSDGCQPAYLFLAGKYPGFATAACRNTRLMRACTHNGLLYGGPHYVQAGAPPCVHHTFTHAKALTKVLEDVPGLGTLDTSNALPRETARGVREFQEINTLLIARGPWRATVTSYDSIYRTTHATGGALSLLHHRELGTLCAASLAKYEMPERNNMQPQPDDFDFPLTPRVERRVGGKWYTNLWDLTAAITHEDKPEAIDVHAQTRLLDETQHGPEDGAMAFELGYCFTNEAVSISVRPTGGAAGPWSLVIPVVSPKGEAVRQVTDRRFEVAKSGGRVVIEANAPLRIMEPARDRVFNIVPGLQAVPFAVDGSGVQPVECTIRMKS